MGERDGEREKRERDVDKGMGERGEREMLTKTESPGRISHPLTAGSQALAPVSIFYYYYFLPPRVPAS